MLHAIDDFVWKSTFESSSRIHKSWVDINQKIGNKTALSAACEEGNWNVAEELVKTGVNIKNVPLIISCWEDKPTIVEKLKQEEADVLFVNNEYENPITKTYPGNTMYYHSTFFLEDQQITANHYEQSMNEFKQKKSTVWWTLVSGFMHGKKEIHEAKNWLQLIVL